MSNPFLRVGILLSSVVFLASCSMMAGMMGMGDKWDAMMNMDEVMDEDGMSMEKIMAKRSEEEAKAYARGKDLFADASLGKSAASCNSCHPGGRASKQAAAVIDTGLKVPVPSLQGVAAAYPKYDPANNAVISLQMKNNNCITMFMGGKPLDLESWDSYALALYVTSFSNGDPVQASK